MEIKFIIDITDLEPLNLAYKSSNTEEDVIIRGFFFFLNGEQLTFDNI